MAPLNRAPAIEEALALIAATPGHAEVAASLTALFQKGRIHANPQIEDRARANLLGSITLGPEAVGANPLSLAQTLVHEQHHLRQNPFLKTVSFWSGVLTRTPVMKRYEQPAYQAAIDFLEAVKNAHPQWAQQAAAEQQEVRAAFAAGYRGWLK